LSNFWSPPAQLGVYLKEISFGSGPLTLLEATGLPLGLFVDAKYEVRSTLVRPGEALLLFTDGLTDSIFGKDPEARVRDALRGNSKKTMARLQSLIDSRLNQDDVTILLVRRKQ